MAVILFLLAMLVLALIFHRPGGPRPPSGPDDSDIDDLIEIDIARDGKLGP